MKTRTGHLFKRKGIFYVQWRVNEKLFMRSTGTRNRGDAEERRKEIMAPFVVGNEVTVLQNIAAQIEGRKAELERLEDERNPPLTIERAWNAYLSASRRPDSGDNTLCDYASHFQAFASWMKATHNEASALRDVTSAIAGEYAAHLMKRGLSGNRFNKHIRFMALLFHVLKEPARLSANPWEGIQRKRTIIQSRRELTTDELKAVCAAAAGEMRLLFALGIYTGLRLGDAATLRWAEVDLHRKIIRRIPSKIARRNPRPVIIPIHPTLADMLSKTPPEGRSEYVLPDTAVLYLRDAQRLSKRIQGLFASCGIRTVKRGTGNGTDKRAVVEVGFHSLRHTFVSLCRESNAPLSVVEAIVGHSNPAMTRHYTHVSELAAARAVNGLPDITGTACAALPAARMIDAAMVKQLADKLNGKNWKEVKAELLNLA